MEGYYTDFSGCWAWGAEPMVYATEYFWVVICKNYRFHHKGNTSYAHQIPLAVTDAFSALPALTEQIKVRCDRCGEEYPYKASDVLRNEIEVPEQFMAHPLFQQEATQQESNQ